MKNHVRVDGRLLQTNKTWSHLKQKQKEWIAAALRQEFMACATTKNALPNKADKVQIIDSVYAKIEACGIWIPYGEVLRFFCSRIHRYSVAAQDLIAAKDDVDTDNHCAPQTQDQ